MIRKLFTLLLSCLLLLPILSCSAETISDKNPITQALAKVKVKEKVREKNGAKFVYPAVKVLGNAEATEAINNYFERSVLGIEKAYRQKIKEGERISFAQEFVVTYASPKLLCLKTYYFLTGEDGVEPLSYAYGYTFDLTNGELVDWRKLISENDKNRCRLPAINAKLHKDAAGQLYPNFKGLTKLPEEYYLDEEGTLHFLFQQYEIAPYEVGIIDLDMEVHCSLQ